MTLKGYHIGQTVKNIVEQIEGLKADDLVLIVDHRDNFDSYPMSGMDALFDILHEHYFAYTYYDYGNYEPDPTFAEMKRSLLWRVKRKKSDFPGLILVDDYEDGMNKMICRDNLRNQIRMMEYEKALKRSSK